MLVSIMLQLAIPVKLVQHPVHNRRDRADLLARMNECRPDILVIGPTYKLDQQGGGDWHTDAGLYATDPVKTALLNHSPVSFAANYRVPTLMATATNDGTFGIALMGTYQVRDSGYSQANVSSGWKTFDGIQDKPDLALVVKLLEPVDARARKMIEAERLRLRDWLGDVRLLDIATGKPVAYFGIEQHGDHDTRAHQGNAADCHLRAPGPRH